MNIAVTGSTGQLGCTLLRKLERYELRTLSLNRRALDFLSMRSINDSLSGFRPDVIVNCAAFTKVDDSETRAEAAFAVNATAPTLLAKYCHREGIRLIQISTDSIFSSSFPKFFKPADQPSPLNMYSRSKLQGERGVLKENPVGTTIIRTSWLFGSGSNKFLQAIVRQGEKGEAFSVVDDQFGQPTSTNSLAEFVIFLIMSESSNGIYHFASSDYASRFDFAKSILEMSQLDSGLINPCKTTLSFDVAERPKYSLLEVSESTTNGYTGISKWKHELASYFRSMAGDQ